MNSSKAEDTLKYADNNDSTFIPEFRIWQVIFIFSIYIIITIISLFAMIIVSVRSLANTNTSNALYGVVSTSMLGCSIYYVRKLYKMCIGNRVIFLDKSSDNASKLRNIGAMIYFLMRPVFAVSFSIVVFLGLRSGMISISNNQGNLTLNFIYLSMFISFFIGFSSGKFLESLQEKSEHIIESLWKKK